MHYSSKISGILILLAGWLIASCTALPAPESTDDPNTVNKFVLRASLPEGATKTSLKLEGEVYKVVWNTGDKVSINGNLSNAVAASDNEKKAVDFTVNGSPSAPYKVLYPGTTSSNVITLPATQNYVAGSFDPAAAASYGNARKRGEDYICSLTHFCGVIRFALKGTATLDRIELNSLGSEKLYGPFTLETNSEGFTDSWSGGTAGTLTYRFGTAGLTLGASDTPIYIAIPAQRYASGIEALVYQKDGAFMRLKFWGSGYALDKDVIVEFESKTYAAGRTENLLTIAELTAEAGGEPTAEAPGITVATYNVMRMDPDDRPSAVYNPTDSKAEYRPANAIVRDCAAMKVALGQAIYNTGADLIGFQEIGEKMNYHNQTYSIQDMAVAQGANSYTWKLQFPASDDGEYHYCNGFAYKSSVLTLNDSGKAWLRKGSETYNTSSSGGEDSGSPHRTVVWAKFTHNLSGKVFYFFVTQLPTYGQDGGSGTSNTNMAGGVNAFANYKAGSYPHILAGDLNSAPGHNNEAGYNKLKTYWTDAYEAVSAAGNLAPFYQTYPGTQSGTQKDCQYPLLTFTMNHPERRVDHIMTKGACTAQSYRTIRSSYEISYTVTVNEQTDTESVTLIPSDHLPVVCYVTLD